MLKREREHFARTDVSASGTLGDGSEETRRADLRYSFMN